MRPLLYLLTLCACLSACGQTGPLTIPQQESAPENGSTSE